MTDERLEKLKQLRLAAEKSIDVRRAMVTATSRLGVQSIGHLAEEQPETFDDLADGLLSMVEELPWA